MRRMVPWTAAMIVAAAPLAAAENPCAMGMKQMKNPCAMAMHDGGKHHGMKHGMHGWRDWLRKADANGDGKVTKAEFMRASKRYAERKFRWLDANGDGVLDARDREARMMHRFDRIDANGDGAISREEWTAFHRRMHRMHETHTMKKEGDR